MYKGLVEIPPLGMVDDLICVSECVFQSARMNSYINFKTNSTQKNSNLEFLSVRKYTLVKYVRSTSAKS